MNKFLILCALSALAVALPLDEYYAEAYIPGEIVEEIIRSRRSLQPGAPNIPGQGQQNQGGWSANPNIGRDDQGNTNANIQVQHTGKDHDFNAQWGKVIRGPGRAKPTWSVGGTYRW